MKSKVFGMMLTKGSFTLSHFVYRYRRYTFSAPSLGTSTIQITNSLLPICLLLRLAFLLEFVLPLLQFACVDSHFGRILFGCQTAFFPSCNPLRPCVVYVCFHAALFTACAASCQPRGSLNGYFFPPGGFRCPIEWTQSSLFNQPRL